MAFEDAKRTNHPSFGVVNISRGMSSESMNLFGSSIKQRTFMSLTISHAELMRDLHQDTVFPKDAIITVYLSPSQFADAITSLNQGEGTPCTIDFLNGHKVPEPRLESKRVQFDNEFEEQMEKITSETNRYMKKISELLEKSSVGKRDRAEILKQIGLLQQELYANVPFIKRQFTEQMDETVVEAKNEITNFIENKLKTLGLEGLKKELIAKDLLAIEDKGEKNAK